MTDLRKKIGELGLEKVYPFRSHFLNLGEHHLHYLDEGKGDPILMLQGSPSWSFLYRNLVQTFSPRFRIIVPDHQGSDTLEAQVRNTHQLLTFLELRRMILIVHGEGARIGLTLAYRYPELFERIIILNTSPVIPRNKRNPREWSRKMLKAFVGPFTRFATVKKLPRLLSAGYLLPYASFWSKTATVDQTENEFPPQLKTLPQPKLILWGGRDIYSDRESFEEWLELFPDASAYWFAGAGHYLLEDALDDVSAKIWDFIKDRSLSP